MMGKDQPEEMPVELDYVMSIVQQPTMFSIVMMNFPIRLGVTSFVTAIEYILFPPSNPEENRKFHVIMAEWQEMHFIILVIPRRRFDLVHGMSRLCGLRMRHDHIPVMITSDGPIKFPVGGRGVFMVENLSGHPQYRMSQQEIMIAHQTELQFANDFVEGKQMRLDFSGFTKFATPARKSDNVICL